jgi:hypothetical protein
MNIPFINRHNNGNGGGVERGSDGYHLRAYSVLPPDHFGKNRITQTLAKLVPDGLKAVPENRTRSGFKSKKEAELAAQSWQRDLNHPKLNSGGKHLVRVKQGSNY